MQYLIVKIANDIQNTILYKMNDIKIRNKIIQIMNNAYNYKSYYNLDNLGISLGNNKNQLFLIYEHDLEINCRFGPE